MDYTVIHQLEAAASVIMAQPMHVKPEERQQAESIFMSFRNSKSIETLEICRKILDNSKVDLVLFEAINITKSIVTTQWDLLEDNVQLGLRQYLFEYVLQHASAPFFIREKILQVVAIMIKRSILIDGGAQQRVILEQVKTMLSSTDQLQTLLASTLILALVQEYADTIKSEDVGLTFDEHFKAKKLFEGAELRNVFVMVLETMGKFAQNLPGFDAQNMQLLQKCFNIMEIIFTWGYISPIMPKRLISLCEIMTKTNQSPPLRLCAQWKPVILDPKVLETFFYLYWKVRDIPDLRSKALTCLIQLSTLNGAVLQKKENERIDYLTSYLGHFMPLLGCENCADEVIGFTFIIRKLMLFHHSCTGLCEDSLDLFKAFIDKLYNITMKSIEGAVTDTSGDGQLFNEAFENCLESWISLVQSKDGWSDAAGDFMSNFLIQIFNKYVQAHLSPPEGIRSNEVEEEIVEHEERDRDRYKEQLIIIGTFAREVISHSMPILAKLLEDKTRVFASMLQTIYQTQAQVSEKDQQALCNIFEDLHWLLLITCYSLCMSAEGETPMIPSEINDYCQQLITEGRVDLQKSLELIAKPDKDIVEVFGDSIDRADLIIRITAAILRLSELESTAANFNMSNFLSPELSSTLMFFMQQWLDMYLFPVADYYQNLCESVKIAFSAESDCGKWLLNYILNKICFNIQHFSGEDGVIEDTIDVFLTILKRNQRILPVFSAGAFPTLLNLKNNNLHVSAKRGLLKGLVQIANAVKDDDQRLAYLDQIFMPIANKYNETMHRADIKVTYQNEDVKLAIISVLEEVRGCVQGAFFHSSNSLFNNFRVMFLELPELFNLYKNYNVIVELVLQLLCETIINIDYTSGQTNSSIMVGIYECCTAIIKVWTTNNGSKVVAESRDYQDCPEDILLIFKLLHCLLSKHLIDDEIEESHIDSGQVVIFGLTSLLPLITMDLIRFPEFCTQYYKTIVMFAETKTHQIIHVPYDLLKQILNSIDLGLKTFTQDIQSYCFEFIICLANALYFEKEVNTPTYGLLMPFHQTIFKMVFERYIDSENKIDCYNALFSLSCVYKENFQNLMMALVTSQQGLQAQKLQQEYNDFFNSLDLSNNRSAKLKFTEKFDKFVTAVGFVAISH